MYRELGSMAYEYLRVELSMGGLSSVSRLVPGTRFVYAKSISRRSSSASSCWCVFFTGALALAAPAALGVPASLASCYCRSVVTLVLGCRPCESARDSRSPAAAEADAALSERPMPGTPALPDCASKDHFV